MKIKSLLIGMLASIALVGCTNEELIETEDIKKPQAELVRGDAYVNFVINTKTDSSRGTVGDNHQNADDNGHHAAAQRNENTVKELLVVIAKVEDTLDEKGNATGKDKYTKEKNGMAKLYGNLAVEDQQPNVETRNGYVGVLTYSESDENSAVKKNTAGNYTLAKSIRMDYTGHYAVLVVVNPVKNLRDEVLKKITNYKEAYETVLKYDGEAYTEGTNEITSFQMSNKHECIVYTDASNNDPAKPAAAKIEVERTVSKATWRWATPLTDTNLPAALKGKQNVYSVNVNVTDSKVETASFWYKDVKNPGQTNQYDAYLYSEEFNKATDASGQIWWVLFKKDFEGDKFTTGGQVKFDAIEAIFKGQTTYELYTGVTDIDDDDTESAVGKEVKDEIFTETYAQATATTRLTEAFVRSLTFVYTEGQAPADTYYVHLTHYALTNLTPSVYAVRHIADLNFQNERQFGFLGINEFLVTPYSSTINSGNIPSFTNKLADVIAKADAYKFEENSTLEYFKKLPTEGNDGTADSEHYTEAGASNNVGALMEYIYENSALSTIQNAGNVTGVVLAGQIYDKNGLVDVLYKYNQEYFRTLQALVDKYGEDGVLTTTDGKKITPNSTDVEAEAAAGLDVYAKGRCFYYSTDIKHLEDNDDATIGTMELAIMRNNIYSLAVKSISDIGDARISVEENDPLTDIRSYIQLEVSIKPWIVRFNDLNL